MTMFHKTLIGLAALAVVGAAAFTFSAPTTASANGWQNHRHHNHWRPSVRFSGPAYNSYGSCFVRRIVPTPYGPRVTTVNVCY